MVALVVPVMSNFTGFARLMESVDLEVRPFIYDNWTENWGVSLAWNYGIQAAIDYGHNEILIVNDDVVLYPGTAQKLVESLDKYGLVSAVNSKYSDIADWETYSDDAFPDFSCFALSRDTVDKIGYFDEKFFAYFNDNDYSYRLNLAGIKQAARHDAGMYHEGSVTQNMGGDGDKDPRVISHEAFREARAIYVSKWGGEPRSETYTKPYQGES